MEILELLPRGTIAALELAVQNAREWRGYYTHDAELLAAFDADVKRMRAALAAVKKQQRAIRYMMSLAQAAQGEEVAVGIKLH